MPDGDRASRSPRQEVALASVDAWLFTQPGAARRLSAAGLAEYRARHFIAGWRIAVDFAAKSDALALDILADRTFPYSPVRVALADRTGGRGWPHVEADGVLCLLPNSASVDVDAPVHVVRNQLGDACSLIEASLVGTNRDDFLSEVGSYWTRGLPTPQVGLRTLIRVDGPTRAVKVWRSKRFDLVGDDDEACLRWLRHLGAKVEARDLAEGLFLWMDCPPYPDEYPGTGAELHALVAARCPDGLGLLEAQVARNPADLVVLFGSRTGDRLVVLGATLAKGAAHQRSRTSRDPSSSGFTGRAIPPSVAVPRYLGSATALRRLVTRVDPDWIHGRDLDAGAQALGDMKVAVLGCGSVGGPIAVRLAQAGVGSLYLVDGDLLSSANVGRHPLGVSDIHSPKAVGLANGLRIRFPHLRAVEGIAADWRIAHAEHPDLLGSCDLIVAAMADWTSDSMLNEWHIAQGRRKPILYVWTEAHACAGHAVLITGEGGCLRCGFSSAGTPSLRVCEWPTETQLREPACGAVFQPYGPVGMAHVEALACEMATDALLSPPPASAHHVWAARRSLLTSTGGSWTPEWVALHPGRDGGAFTDQRSWNRGPCPTCGHPPS